MVFVLRISDRHQALFNLVTPGGTSDFSRPLIGQTVTSSKSECALWCLTSFDCGCFYFNDVTKGCKKFRDAVPDVIITDADWKFFVKGGGVQP